MPRKPKVGETVVIHANGRAIRVTLFPPDHKRKERSWYAYWNGLRTRISTKKRTKAEAIEAVREVLCGRPASPAKVLTDDELVQIQKHYFEKQKAGRDRPESCDKSLTNVLEAFDAFKRVSGLEHMSTATPDECERFQTAALKLPSCWRRPPEHKYKKTKTVSVATVYKWLGALQGAFERANAQAGRKCVRGVVPQEKLLTRNPWNEFTWIPKPKAKPRRFDRQQLINLRRYFESHWEGVTAAELMLKLFVWSWARRSEVVSIKYTDLREIDGVAYVFMSTKRQGEKWCRLPRSVYEAMLAIKTESPYVFAVLSEQLRSYHRTKGKLGTAKQIKDFSPYNGGRWFYEQLKSWSGGESYVHMLRKTIMQMARAGEDVNLAVARDASVTKGVMLAHYVSEEDSEMKAKADRMYRRICEGLTAEVARHFGHDASRAESLEQQLRDAVALKDWKLVETLSARLAQRTEGAAPAVPRGRTAKASRGPRPCPNPKLGSTQARLDEAPTDPPTGPSQVPI